MISIRQILVFPMFRKFGKKLSFPQVVRADTDVFGSVNSSFWLMNTKNPAECIDIFLLSTAPVINRLRLPIVRR